MRASIELLEEKYPGKGREAFGRIAELSGAGSLGAAGMGEQPAGIDLTGYETNEGISEENRAEIKKILTGSGAADPAEALAKKFGKEELAEFAKQAGLDGNTYSNKIETVKAILATGFTIPE